MACVKQYPAAVFFNPNVETYATFSEEGETVSETTVDTVGASGFGDVKERTGASATSETLGDNISYTFESQPYTAEECSDINSRLKTQEKTCAEERIAAPKRHFATCKRTGDYVMRTAVSRVKDRCSPTGEIVRECRRCYHQGSRVPNSWWNGPFGALQTDIDPLDPYDENIRKKVPKNKKKKTKQREYKPDMRVDNIINDPYLKQGPRFYCLEYDSDELMTAEIAKCIDKTSHYYDDHRYINRNSSGGQSYCITFFTTKFAGRAADRSVIVDHLENKYGTLRSDIESDAGDDAFEREANKVVRARTRSRRKKTT